MDYETISPAEFGARLRGLGLNLLVRDLRAEAGFLSAAFGLGVHRLNDDFAILTYGAQLLQLHADHTYARHPLHALLPGTPPRGAGAALHLFDTDPDEAAARAGAAGGHVLQAPLNKPHGLRETCILSPAGYAWIASRPLTDDERTAT
jgi:predicted enzyme related to lactoylglutathione lyase